MQHPVDIISLIGSSNGLIEVPLLLCMAFPCTATDPVVICDSASVKVEDNLLSLADGPLWSVGELRGNGFSCNDQSFHKAKTQHYLVFNTTAPCAECRVNISFAFLWKCARYSNKSQWIITQSNYPNDVRSSSFVCHAIFFCVMHNKLLKTSIYKPNKITVTVNKYWNGVRSH